MLGQAFSGARRTQEIAMRMKAEQQQRKQPLESPLASYHSQQQPQQQRQRQQQQQRQQLQQQQRQQLQQSPSQGLHNPNNNDKTPDSNNNPAGINNNNNNNNGTGGGGGGAKRTRRRRRPKKNGSSVGSGQHSQATGGARHNSSSNNSSSKKQHDAPMSRRDLYFCLRCGVVSVGTEEYDTAVGRVTLVNWDNQIVLDEFVQTVGPVVDLRTPYTGITPEILASRKAVPFDTVRHKLSHKIRGKILIGHGLEVDLAYLGLSHPWSDVRDTATYAPFMKNEGGGMLLPRQLDELTEHVFQHGLSTLLPPLVREAVGCLDLYKHARENWEKQLMLEVQQKERQRQMIMKMRAAGRNLKTKDPGKAAAAGTSWQKEQPQQQQLGILELDNTASASTEPTTETTVAGFEHIIAGFDSTGFESSGFDSSTGGFDSSVLDPADDDASSFFSRGTIGTDGGRNSPFPFDGTSFIENMQEVSTQPMGGGSSANYSAVGSSTAPGSGIDDRSIEEWKQSGYWPELIEDEDSVESQEYIPSQFAATPTAVTQSCMKEEDLLPSHLLNSIDLGPSPTLDTKRPSKSKSWFGKGRNQQIEESSNFRADSERFSEKSGGSEEGQPSSGGGRFSLFRRGTKPSPVAPSTIRPPPGFGGM